LSAPVPENVRRTTAATRHFTEKANRNNRRVIEFHVFTLPAIGRLTITGRHNATIIGVEELRVASSPRRPWSL
jgi:hypothetical protein